MKTYPVLNLAPLDRKINTDIREKIQIDYIIEEIKTYRKKYKYYVDRMGENKWPKITCN